MKEDRIYIVYTVKLGDKYLYIGSGKFGREAHCKSGVSHVYGLNKAHFDNIEVDVRVVRKLLTKKESMDIEREYIKRFNPLYNIVHVVNRLVERNNKVEEILESFRGRYGHDHYHKCRDSIIEIFNLIGLVGLENGVRMPSTVEAREYLKLPYSRTLYEKIRSAKGREPYMPWLEEFFEVDVGNRYMRLKLK